MIATKRIFIVKKVIVVSQNRTSFKVKKFFAKITQTRRSTFAIFIFIIIDDDDLVEMFETSLVSQDIARLRAKLQREEETQRVETIDIVETNELKIKIKQLQVKRDISMLQHHAHDEKSFENRRSFLHQSNELSQFFSLFMMFLVVNRKHFAKIFKCTFMSKQLHKLINDYSIKNILNIDAKNELIDFDIKDMSHLTKCFEMYCQIVLELILESMYRKLNKIFFMYRCHLNVLLINYIFDSMLIFHKIFMYARINEIQNDLERWKIIDKRMKNNYLIRRNKDFENNKFKNSKLDKLVEEKMSYDYCKRFNHDFECQSCFWKYQYVVCQLLNHNMKKCFQIFSFSKVNKTFIDISRRQ